MLQGRYGSQDKYLLVPRAPRLPLKINIYKYQDKTNK